MKRLIKSFKYAFGGIIHTIKTEQNMRIHLSAANLVIVFAYFFGISKPEWASLFLLIGFVIFAEFVNTAIERAADAVTKDYNINIKYAKDAAAGGVIVAALTAIAGGIAIFGDLKKIAAALIYIFTNPFPAALLTCLFLADVLFLVMVKEK